MGLKNKSTKSKSVTAEPQDSLANLCSLNFQMEKLLTVGQQDGLKIIELIPQLEQASQDVSAKLTMPDDGSMNLSDAIEEIEMATLNLEDAKTFLRQSLRLV